MTVQAPSACSVSPPLSQRVHRPEGPGIGHAASYGGAGASAFPLNPGRFLHPRGCWGEGQSPAGPQHPRGTRAAGPRPPPAAGEGAASWASRADGEKPPAPTRAAAEVPLRTASSTGRWLVGENLRVGSTSPKRGPGPCAEFCGAWCCGRPPAEVQAWAGGWAAPTPAAGSRPRPRSCWKPGGRRGSCPCGFCEARRRNPFLVSNLEVPPRFVQGCRPVLCRSPAHPGVLVGGRGPTAARPPGQSWPPGQGAQSLHARPSHPGRGWRRSWQRRCEGSVAGCRQGASGAPGPWTSV